MTWGAIAAGARGTRPYNTPPRFERFEAPAVLRPQDATP